MALELIKELGKPKRCQIRKGRCPKCGRGIDVLGDFGICGVHGSVFVDKRHRGDQCDCNLAMLSEDERR